MDHVVACLAGGRRATNSMERQRPLRADMGVIASGSKISLLASHIMKVAGATAFITGGASGIGHAFALSVLRQGGNVAIVDIDAVRGGQIEADLVKSYGAHVRRVKFIPCDVTKPGALAGTHVLQQQLTFL